MDNGDPDIKMIDFLTIPNLSDYAEAVARYFSDDHSSSFTSFSSIDSHSFQVTDWRGTFIIKQLEDGSFSGSFIPDSSRTPRQVRAMKVLSPEKALEALEVFVKAYNDTRGDRKAGRDAVIAMGYTRLKSFVSNSGTTYVVAFANADGEEFAIRVSQAAFHDHIEESLASIQLANNQGYDNYAQPIVAVSEAQAFPYLQGEKSIIDVQYGSGGGFRFNAAEKIELIGGVMIDIVQVGGYDSREKDLTEVLSEI